MFRFIRPPLAVVGNETVAEDTLADGEKKAVAVAEVELANGEGAPLAAEDELELDAAFVLVFLFLFFSLTCLPTNRAATFSPDAAPCAIRSCLSNAVPAAVLFQSNSLRGVASAVFLVSRIHSFSCCGS